MAVVTPSAPLHHPLEAARHPLKPVRAGWRAWVRPSFTDLFFAVLLFWMFLADPLGWDRLLWDGDTALHTRIGDFILDHGYVPTRDPFSFTRPGARFFSLEWLTGVIFAELNRLAGLKGIVLLCGVAIALYLTLLARDMAKRGVNSLLALILVLLAASASAIHYHARPHIFTLLFLAIAGFMIAEDRARPSWRIWMLPALMILWVNMHSGFAALLALVGILVVGRALVKDWAQVRRFSAVLASCALASLINPTGIALHRHMSEFMNNSWAMANVNEYQSPVFRSEPMSCYMAILFLGIAAAAWYFSRRQWTECLWIVFFAAGSLTSARHIPLFVMVALPLIGMMLTDVWKRATAGQPRTSVLAVLGEVSEKLDGKLQPVSVWTAAVVIGVAVFAHQWPSDLSAKYFPRDAVRQFEPQLAAARVFTTDQWGDYLLWTGYPHQKVFMDGRSDLYGEQVGREYLTLLDGLPGWRDTLDRYRVDMVLVPPDTPLVELLTNTGAWKLLHRDQQSVLLARQP